MICSIHFFKIKAKIMQAARSQDTMLFNETPVILLFDLSNTQAENVVLSFACVL